MQPGGEAGLGAMPAIVRGHGRHRHALAGPAVELGQSRVHRARSVELGLAGRESELLSRLGAEPRYQRLFPDAFPDEPMPFSVANVTKAIASFERTLLSGRSPYDRYRTTFTPPATLR